MTHFKWKDIFQLIKDTFHEFNEDNAIYYSASLSYFTIFALPSIIIIIITVAGTVFGKESISSEIYEQIESLAGHKSALQIQEMVSQANQAKSSFPAKAIGLLTLLFAATGVFTAIQSALNIMWEVKPKPKHNIIKLLKDRILSFALIVSIAFLLLVSLVVHAVLVALANLFDVKHATVLLLQLVNFVVPLGVVTLLFAMIFKFLPDAKIEWKDVWIGSFVTALLFTGGKFFIGLYIGNSDIGSAYGAAGTILIILLWVFFSSILLFLGAEFTQVYVRKYRGHIEPSAYAVKFERKIIESDKSSRDKKS